MSVLLTSTVINPAFSILSENKPKKYSLTPIETEQSTQDISTRQLENISKESNSPTSNNNTKDKSNKISEPRRYNNKITITSQRIDSENLTEDISTQSLSDALSNLRSSLYKNGLYEFMPSAPENDFITLSALDIIVTDMKNSLSGFSKETISVDAEPKCQTDFTTCNDRLFSSISSRLEQIEFLKNSKQALGEPTTIPKIRLKQQSTITKDEITFAFLAPDVLEQSLEKSFTKPSNLSYAIREILKNKESLFSGSETRFIDNLKTLQSKLVASSKSNPNLSSHLSKSDTNVKDSNLSFQSTQQTIKQLNDFVQFVEVKKIVINNAIITSNMDTNLQPIQLLNTLEQDASPITSLYDLMKYYISNNGQQLQKNESLRSQILLWFADYTNLIDSMKNLKIPDEKISDENLQILSELQDNIRKTKKEGIKISDSILNSRDGLKIFGDMLPELSDLNKQMKDTQNKIPFQDLDLIMLQITDDLNQLLATLSNQNIDKLKTPVNQKTLNYFSDLVPENQAMKEIMSYILSENLNKNNTFESGLSGAGLTSNDNGFFDYQSDYLRLNANAPEKQATKILDSFNYVSETY